MWQALRTKEVRTQMPNARDFKDVLRKDVQGKTLDRNRRLDEVVAFVAANGSVTRVQIQKALPHISLSTMTAYMMDLTRDGRLVANRATPTSARKKLYSIPEAEE